MIIWLNQRPPSFAERLLEQMKNGGGPQLKLAASSAMSAMSGTLNGAIRAAVKAQEKQIREQLMRGLTPTIVVYDELDTSDMLDAMHYVQLAYSPKNAVRIAGV